MHEETALTPPDDDDGSEAVSEGRETKEEGSDRPPRSLRPIQSDDGQEDSRGRLELLQYCRNESPGRKGIHLPPIPILEQSICAHSVRIVGRRKIWTTLVI